MQELAGSGHDRKSLAQIFKQSTGEALGASENFAHMDFGNCSLIEIHELSNLTNMHFHQANNHLPTLLLDGPTNTTEHHIVTAGETISEIAAEHLGPASASEIYNLVNQIGELNHIDSLDQINPGQYLVFPELPNFAHVTNVSATSANSTSEVASTETASTEIATAEPDATAVQPAGEESAISDFLSGLGNVVSEIGQGCVEQITEHPLEVAVAAAATIAASLTAIAVAPLVATGLATVGVAATGAEVLATIGLIGTTKTSVEFLSNAGDWLDAALVVGSPEGHSSAELVTAETELHEVSDFVVDQASGLLGGLYKPQFSPSNNGLRKGLEDDDSEEQNEEA